MASQTTRTTKAMGSLSLDVPSKAPTKSKGAKGQKVVVDSWDDESPSPSDTDDPPTPTNAHLQPGQPYGQAPGSGFAAPPPTPASPMGGLHAPWLQEEATKDAADARRPEKTDAVARRMIAGALGVKAPKATEEQKAYERAVREKERRRREEERDAERRRQEEAERAKAAIWND
jgi:hypothetical protein